MQPDLTIVVATLMHLDLLEDCLMTLRHHAWYPARVVVMDGNHEVEMIRRVDAVVAKADVEVVHLGENRKAMGAFNEALKGTDTEYIAFLHDDAAFVPGSDAFWPRLMKVASYREVGMCGPSISNCTGLQHFLRWDLPPYHETDYLYGACMMFRTDFIRDIGGMTEEISPCDDIELAVRVRKLGYKIVVDRRCFLYHHRHMTYSLTRPKEGDKVKLERTFNAIIRKHGVKATLEHVFHTPDWDWIKQTSPSWKDIERRLEQKIERWIPGESCGVRPQTGQRELPAVPA